ncbi:hypothetical protein IHE44_0009697 [Lamprotornis superbus]|uniref:Disintegrin and metalloproteinase domain-containing protein 17 n=1 Tax=Lamprotornis superbus TaxID=245042 RepID=A0A835U1V6_9PASS|nr:hypothetical protein IHE44_0009697 [Lamprotornis superbus]
MGNTVESMLSDYDILSLSSIQQHSLKKRDLQPETHVERLLSFSALQSTETEEREHNSKVVAHIGDEDFTVRISTDGEEYNIEPLWRFVDDVEDERLLVYRSEDIKDFSRLQSPKVCGYLKLNDDELLPKGLEDRKQNEESAHRKIRAIPENSKNTCKMLVVADHRFFKYMGRGEESTTINYLIELIDRVDDIYRNTSWDDGTFNGYGIQIEQIIIHNEPNPVKPGQRHYNMARSYPDDKKDAWDVKMLLEQFSFDIAEKAAHVCLAHLFTYQDFDMGTLGLAYVGSPRPNSHAYYSQIAKKDIYLNSGLTSTKNYGKTILTKEADLVTTHELGHNFGAEHDPDSLPECAPTEDQGGKYVMYPIAVSGDHENNKMFSSCSKKSIHRTIEVKAQECFKERNNKVCGNSRVDEGEECDPGLLYQLADPCCSADCKLKDGAKCSLLVFDGNNERNSSECPPPGNAPDDTVCVDMGKCKDGECVPFCEREKNLRSCACNETDNSCKVCCRDEQDRCTPYVDANDQFLFLRKGKPCTVGFCDTNDKKLDKQYEENTKSLFCPSNVEMLSSLDSASVRIIKPFPAAQATSRHQPLQPLTAAPAAPTAPRQDHQRMDTIQEDPSTDSHIDEDAFEKDPFPNSSSAAKSFEDLTDHPVIRSEKASSFKLQRQNREQLRTNSNLLQKQKN